MGSNNPMDPKGTVRVCMCSGLNAKSVWCSLQPCRVGQMALRLRFQAMQPGFDGFSYSSSCLYLVGGNGACGDWVAVRNVFSTTLVWMYIK